MSKWMCHYECYNARRRNYGYWSAYYTYLNAWNVDMTEIKKEQESKAFVENIMQKNKAYIEKKLKEKE